MVWMLVENTIHIPPFVNRGRKIVINGKGRSHIGTLGLNLGGRRMGGEQANGVPGEWMGRRMGGQANGWAGEWQWKLSDIQSIRLPSIRLPSSVERSSLPSRSGSARFVPGTVDLASCRIGLLTRVPPCLGRMPRLRFPDTVGTLNDPPKAAARRLRRWEMPPN